MGKHGPCYHCGVTSTPLWRNGPPEKPILCNACGSRWRTKGTLLNYTPLHARAEPDEFEDYRVSRVKSLSIKNREAEVLKREQNHENEIVQRVALDYDQGSRQGLDDDNSNRSSSGSAISNSESCAQFGCADASDLTGPAQTNVWDTMVPSRKRTCVGRSKPSSVEKLTKDLYTIFQEQSSHFSGSSEEDLLFESNIPMVSVEIGHGSVLIRHPNSIAREEESEASSITVDNKTNSLNEAYSHLTARHVDIGNEGTKFPGQGIDNGKKLAGLGMQQDQIKREKAQHEKLQMLGDQDSPLSYADLKDIVNFDVFSGHLTNEEQQQLLKYLPSIDTARFPDSLKIMFASPQFEENLSSFQKLLAEGVFDLSFSSVKAEEYSTLNRLALCSMTKSKWVEQYNLLKNVQGQTANRGSVVPTGSTAIASGKPANVKRLRDGQPRTFLGTKTTIKIPKRVTKGGMYEHKELVDNDGSCFSPRSLFALPPDSSSLMLNSFQFMDESSDQDLLLDVPSNNSFPQAELLFPTSGFGAQASTSSSSIQPQLVQPSKNNVPNQKC